MKILGVFRVGELSFNFDTIALGFGYADVENQVGATPNTVMRIASISKSITMAALGKLMDEGRVELDKSVSDLVQEWPKVSTQAETNNICVMLRFNHSSTGIREGKHNDAAVGQSHFRNPPLH